MAVDDDRTAGTSHERLFAPAPAGGGGGTGAPARPVLGATTTPWVLDLIRRFRAAGPSMRVCAHLAEEPDQGATWQASVPDLRSCRRPACTSAVLAVQEERAGRPPHDEPTRCTTCGRVGLPVRGVGVAVGPTMLRGTVCEDCLAARPVPTPSSATAPVAGDAPVLHPALEAAAEPLTGAPEEDADDPATGTRPTSADAAGRRALRRGRLLAEACARTTPAGLDPDGAVLGGLLARAATLAEGLADPVAPGAAVAHDVAFRTLVGTTTTLWWLLRLPPDAAAAAISRFRDAGTTAATAETVRGRLRTVGREDDHARLLGPPADAVPGSWDELVALHLVERADGFAVDLGRSAPDPLRLLIAGEHLSLACADYVRRVPTDVDPDHLRRLADEVTELRADVERRLGDTAPGSAAA